MSWLPSFAGFREQLRGHQAVAFAEWDVVVECGPDGEIATEQLDEREWVVAYSSCTELQRHSRARNPYHVALTGGQLQRRLAESEQHHAGVLWRSDSGEDITVVFPRRITHQS